MTEEQEYYLKVRRGFAIFAPFYDLVTSPFWRVREKAVDFTGAPNGSRILDLATGTGQQAFAFARRGFEVTGVDFCGPMLKIAEKNNKYKNARFRLADAADLGFNDKSFDVVCIFDALHHMPKGIRARVLKEAVRVLRPEGTVVIIDYALPEAGLSRFLAYRIIKLYESKYFPGFIKQDFSASLLEAGIKIKEELPVLSVQKIFKGTTI